MGNTTSTTAVSLGASGIEIELAYDEARLGEIEPPTLEAFGREHGVWEAKGAQVDVDAGTLWFKTTWIGDFGVGGERTKVFLALVLKR